MIVITKDFQKVLKLLLLALFVLYFYTIILEYYRLNSYKILEPNSTLRLILNVFRSFLMSLFLWGGILYVTRERKGSIIAFGITTVGHIIIFICLSIDFYKVFVNLFWVRILLNLISVTVFGWYFFRDRRAFYFGAIVCLLWIGLGVGYYPYELYERINRFLYLLDLRGLLLYDKPLGGTSTISINLLVPIFSQLTLLIDFIVFWFVFNQFNLKNKKFDYSLRTLYLGTPINKEIFSILYWVLRISLMVSIFGIWSYIDLRLRIEQNLYTILYLLLFSGSIYLLTSLYRNVIVTYFISNGQNPDWLYWMLHIPGLNFFVWLYLFLTKLKPISLDSIRRIVPSTSFKSNTEETFFLLKERFRRFDSNRNLRITLSFLIVLYTIVQIIQFIVNWQDNVGMIVSLISLVFVGVITIWYVYQELAMFILFGLHMVLLLVFSFGQPEGMSFSVSMTMVNLIVYYPLFHFHKLNSSTNEEIET